MRTSEELVTLSMELTEDAADRRKVASTREEWVAIDQIESAARYLWSAAAQMEMHVAKYGHVS
jgi:hypothetical protein